MVIFLRLLGYGPVANGNEKGPKGKSLSPEAPTLPSVTGYTKGVAQPAKPEPTIGVPTALPPTKRMPLSSWKGPKPQVPQGYPSQPIVQEQAPVNLQNKAPKPEQYVPQGQAPFPVLAPLIPQGKGPKPATQIAPEIPQGNPQKPVAPALLPFTQSEKAPKPVAQDQQLVAPVYPQGNGPKPVALQPAAPQGKGPKPVAPGLEIPQTKDPKPVAPEPDAPQTAGLPLALEPTPATPQMKGPKVANPGKSLSVDKSCMSCLLKVLTKMDHGCSLTLTILQSYIQVRKSSVLFSSNQRGPTTANLFNHTNHFDSDSFYA